MSNLTSFECEMTPNSFLDEVFGLESLDQVDTGFETAELDPMRELKLRAFILNRQLSIKHQTTRKKLEQLEQPLDHDAIVNGLASMAVSCAKQIDQSPHMYTKYLVKGQPLHDKALEFLSQLFSSEVTDGSTATAAA